MVHHLLSSTACWFTIETNTFLWWDKIALQLRSSSSSNAPLAIREINWLFDYDLCDQVTICLRSERIATDLYARESTDGDLGDHRDQLETSQRSISVLEDLCVLHGALWRSNRAPQIAAQWNRGIIGWNVIVHPCINGLYEPLLKLEHRWVVAPHIKQLVKPC